MKTILSITIWSGLLLGQSLQAQEVNSYSQRQPFKTELRNSAAVVVLAVVPAVALD